MFIFMRITTAGWGRGGGYGFIWTPGIHFYSWNVSIDITYTSCAYASWHAKIVHEAYVLEEHA
jgi:hypothetical protein